ncbi:hypothetical protein DVH24_006252 [Malus domestica]|uniref:Uncharacterized protein n=1 Tax=Malus domestica TaxID=3750 RepID=A0A498KGU9_MALDO|nr:hypothetical protein DVH24_006252 [Malus domestica]
MESGGKGREEEPDGMSVRSPCNASPSSASSLPKDQSEIELELVLLEALEFYPLTKLQEKVPFHLTLLLPGFLTLIPVSLHFLIDSLTLFLYDLHRFDRYFSSDEVLQLLDQFYNLEMLKPDDDEMEILNHEEDFCLPPSFFVKEEP